VVVGAQVATLVAPTARKQVLVALADQIVFWAQLISGQAAGGVELGTAPEAVTAELVAVEVAPVDLRALVQDRD
jgi:hypothetical protein